MADEAKKSSRKCPRKLHTPAIFVITFLLHPLSHLLLKPSPLPPHVGTPSFYNASPPPPTSSQAFPPREHLRWKNYPFHRPGVKVRASNTTTNIAPDWHGRLSVGRQTCQHASDTPTSCDTGLFLNPTKERWNIPFSCLDCVLSPTSAGSHL